MYWIFLYGAETTQQYQNPYDVTYTPLELTWDRDLYVPKLKRRRNLRGDETYVAPKPMWRRNLSGPEI